jgi:hypothetical protein
VDIQQEINTDMPDIETDVSEDDELATFRL